MDGPAPPPEDFSGLTIAQRIGHKNWKARKDGYEAAIAALKVAIDGDDDTAQLFSREPGLLKTAITDANVIAQQDGFGVLCAFLQITEHAGCVRIRSSIAGLCAEKGLAATRPATKTKALEALLLFAEMDQPNAVVDEMLPFLTQRVPKNIAAVLSALREMCRVFGCRLVNPKPIVKALPKAFGHADKNVRAEAQALATEVYRWVGDGMKIEFWDDLKPVQQAELDKLFEQARAGDPPKQERMLLSQRLAAAEGDGAAEGADGADEAEEAELFVPDAVDVLAKLPEGLFQNLGSTKWKDRKEALDELQAVLNKPRIADGSFDELVRALAKTPKDINVMVVTTGAGCIQNLARGLGPGFSKFRSLVLGPLLDRLKEKKATTLDALAGALDAVYAAAGLGDCLEEIVEYLQHKVPGVRAETGRFVVRCLKSTKTAPTLAETKTVAEAASKLLADSQETQRNVAAEIFGTLWKIMGDRVMAAHLEPIDDLRKAKIKDCFDSAEVRAKYKPKAATAPKPVAAAPAPKKALGGIRRPVVKKAVGGGGAASTAPAAVPQLDATPVAPRLARPGLAKPGVKPIGSLATGKKPAFGLAKPSGSGTTPVLTSPRRPDYPVDDATPAAPTGAGLKLGLRAGLASRPLSRPAAASAGPVSGSTVGSTDGSVEPTMPVITTLTSAERAELEEVRMETDRLRRQNEELRSERARLLAESAELRTLNKELSDSHTCELKAKDMQLRRARSDQATAEQTVESHGREIDRLKRELSRAIRPTSPSTEYQHRGSDMAGDGSSGDGKENYRVSHPASSHKPISGSDSHSGSSRDHTPSGSQHGISYQHHQTRQAGHHQYFSNPTRPAPFTSRPVGSVDQIGTAISTGPTSVSALRNGVEPWKRASEVTENLKARIERMKAQQGARRM